MQPPRDPHSPFARPATLASGAPQWPAPSPPPVPPVKRGRWWIAGLVAGGAVLLSCGGCVTLMGVFAWKNSQFDPADLAGDWMTMNVRYTIVVEGGTPRVSQVVDEDDGEHFVVESCTWDGATLSWVLYVPSTGSRVQETLHATRSGLALGAVNGTFSSYHQPGGGNVGSAIFVRRR
jgi:hypothetical protein